MLSCGRYVQVHEIEHRQQRKADAAAAQAEAAAKLERQERMRQARLHKEELAHEQKLLVSPRPPDMRAASAATAGSVLLRPPRLVKRAVQVLTSMHGCARGCCVTPALRLRICSPSWSPWRPPGSACMPSRQPTLLRRWWLSGKVRGLKRVSAACMCCKATNGPDPSFPRSSGL